MAVQKKSEIRVGACDRKTFAQKGPSKEGRCGEKNGGPTYRGAKENRPGSVQGPAMREDTVEADNYKGGTRQNQACRRCRPAGGKTCSPKNNWDEERVKSKKRDHATRNGHHRQTRSSGDKEK